MRQNFFFSLSSFLVFFFVLPCSSSFLNYLISSEFLSNLVLSSSSSSSSSSSIITRKRILNSINENSTNNFINFSSEKGKIFANGNEFYIKGVNWFGMETKDEVVDGFLNGLTIHSAFSFLKNNSFNAIRIPFAVNTILLNPITQLNFLPIIPEFAGKRLLEILDLLIQEAAKENLLIMLDLHRLQSDSSISELWYDTITSIDDVKKAWNILASRYCNSWNVFAADLKNEPHGSAEWGSGNNKDWKLGAEDIGNSILSICPRWLIFIEGIEGNIKQDHTTGWWGGLLEGVHEYPIKLTDNTKLVYSPHVYGPSVYMQPYFTSSSFPNNLIDKWNNDFGFIPKATQQGLVIGEWGGTYSGLDQTWQNSFIQYLITNKIGSFYWCLNPNSRDTGGLLQDDWKTPVQGKLDFLKNAPFTDVKTILNIKSQLTTSSPIFRITENPTSNPTTTPPTTTPPTTTGNLNQRLTTETPRTTVLCSPSTSKTNSSFIFHVSTPSFRHFNPKTYRKSKPFLQFPSSIGRREDIPP